MYKVWSKFVISSVVGQGGEAGLASINVWSSITIIIGIGLMIGMGASNLMAVYIGKGEKENAQKILGTFIKYF
ncbi:MATE family efflux transporter [Paraclostridium bifermentans]|uniref:MATE family efflux transporter n=1 Tax=Paraclostridium bifermentans TaxID=1490 RepID=UPI00359C93FF